jgi:nucleotide-binding universal stress UspA family protein
VREPFVDEARMQESSSRLWSKAMGEWDMFKTVVWATDGSGAAGRGLPVATSIAQMYEARLLVTHVAEIMAGPPLAVQAAQESSDEITAALRQKVEDLRQDGVTAELAVTDMTGHGPAHTIADLARDQGADLIVVGTRGSNPLVRLLVGSVTRRLLELAPCPVLAVPPEDEDTKA